MSLDWKNENPTAKWEKMTPQCRQTIILNTHIVGIKNITLTTAREFYKRYAMYQTANGRTPVLTPDDVYSAVGLKTNSQTLTYPAFKKLCIQRMEARAEF